MPQGKCTEHINCEQHSNTPYCLCECWPWPTQCIHAWIEEDDGRPRTPPYTKVPFIWKNQTPIKEDWEKITNRTGTVIPIPPRRYVIQIRQKPGQDNVMRKQVEELKAVITPTHNYSYAPEPLHRTESTYQLLDKKGDGRHIILHLTNISSQRIREDLIRGTLRVLNQYKPEIT